MRKITRVLTLTLAFAVLCGSFATIAYARDLAECHHCNTTGEFHCKVCNNTGEVTCGGCGGEGKSKCTGESGKGCDDGYYTCPNCNGDGKMRNGAGEVLDEGVCGNCNGSGKMRCVACHTVPGWNICNGCDGKGKQECQSSNCKDSKAVGWKCHYCMGAGYLLTGNPMPPPEVNDGVRNRPVEGDLIWIDGKSHVYSNGSVSSEPASYHNVSFGTGSWKIGDVTVTADKTGTQKISTIEIITLTNFDPDTMEVRVGVGAEDRFGLILKVTNGKTSISANDHDGGIPYDLTFMVFEKEAVPGGNEGDDENNNNGDNPNQAGKYIVWFGEGSWKIGDVTVTADKTNIQYLNENDIITLKNFDADTMEVRLEAEDGFRTTLLVNNGKTSISANTNNGPIAIDIAFSVVAKEAKPSGEEDGVGDSVIIPSDRNQDFEIPSTESINSIQSAGARVEIGKMTEKEQENYTRLTDEELNKKLVNVQSILQTVRPGEFAADTEELINDVAELNGIDTLEEAKIFPLSFEEHEDLGFPIAVTVRLEKGVLKGDSDLFVYHILEDRSIESLGKAEYTTYDDGSVESITFYTTGFSSFFTSSKELNIDIPAAFPWPLLAAVLVGVIAVVIVGTIVVRKKAKRYKLDFTESQEDDGQETPSMKMT